MLGCTIFIYGRIGVQVPFLCVYKGGSPWETIFTVVEEVESSGSGVACIQARTGVDRVTAAVKGYRDDPVIARTTPVLPGSEVTVHVEGRSKPYGLSVTEFLFPFKICQSSFGGGGGGTDGNNACTLITIFVGNYFLRNVLLQK